MKANRWCSPVCGMSATLVMPRYSPALHDRMPVMLSVDTAKQWLQGGEDKTLLLNDCLTEFKVYKVDRRVNNSREEDAQLIEPV